jgi:ligand-binding SRPBCC domain-containing protein
MSQRFEAEQWIATPLPRVFAFFADPRNLPRIMPPRQGAKLVKLNLVPPRFSAEMAPPDAEQMAGLGTEIVFKFRAVPYLPMHEKWVAVITGFSLNEYFSDTQKQGPFHRWQHTHSFAAKTMGGRDGTLLRDIVEYEVGFGAIGRILETLLFQRMLQKIFEYRKTALERILETER